MEDVNVVDPTGADIPTEVQKTLEFSDSLITCAKIDPRGILLAAGTSEGYIVLYSLRTHSFKAVWAAHALPIQSLSWSGGPGYLLASVARDWSCSVWNVLASSDCDPAISYGHDIELDALISDTAAELQRVLNSPTLESEVKSEDPDAIINIIDEMDDVTKNNTPGSDTKVLVSRLSKLLLEKLERKQRRSSENQSLVGLINSLPESTKPTLLHTAGFNEDVFLVAMNPKRLGEFIILRYFSYPTYMRLLVVDVDGTRRPLTQLDLRQPNGSLSVIEERIVVDFSDILVVSASKSKKQVVADGVELEESPSVFTAFENNGNHVWFTFLDAQFICRVPVSDILMDSKDGAAQVTIPGTKVKNISFNPEAEDFVLNCQDKTIRLSLFDSSLFEIGRFSNLVESTQWLHAIFSARGRYVVAAVDSGESHEVFIWEKDGRLVKRLEGPARGILDGIDYHPTHPLMITLVGGTVTIWNHVYEQNFSGFDPTFKEVSENVEYDEGEDEFDKYTVLSMFVPVDDGDNEDGSQKVRFRTKEECNGMELDQYCEEFMKSSKERTHFNDHTRYTKRQRSMDAVFSNVVRHEEVDIETLDPAVAKYLGV